jgi:ABC-2 type transport system permease protein
MAVLFIKQWRQQRATWLSCAVLLFLMAALLSASYRAFGEMAQQILFSQNMAGGAVFSMLFGGAVAGVSFADAYLSICFVHPVILALLVVFVVAIASRAFAGEIERGTIDVLLAAPITRSQVAVASIAAFMVGLACMLAGHWAGMRVGLWLAGIRPEEVSLPGLRYVSLNLGFLMSSIGSYSFLFSACTSERGRAIGLAAGATVVLYFFNALAQLWSQARFLQHFSVFYYHRPQPILVSGQPPWIDLAVLGGVATLAFAAASWQFMRRDIATV